jgi:uncharacterized membrane protein
MNVDTKHVETFSDGAFAIAITLLALGIAVPPPGTARASFDRRRGCP